ncbi:unnamed protein product [Rangifer tarandus platyrhynchus]|uniref:Uncharacterized protein n=2 Tax=Rangifer tarandus platyrhynchus TaxID=3082113 RepID=A0ACB0FLQ0_RANTA|nr:unnamed protein product [Rangifer tarandus platyrhynchus]CAI9713698.1 unnamed protein product [Rangifer tarandus platyrhynchus]
MARALTLPVRRMFTLPSSRPSQAGRHPPPKSAVSPQGPKHWESHRAGDELHQHVALLPLEGVSSETGSEPLKGGPAGEGPPRPGRGRPCSWSALPHS